jgi:hypothetical protein
MPATPATCTACGAPVLRLLVAGAEGADRKAVTVDAEPGGPRPRFDVVLARYVPTYQRGGWPRELHGLHSWTCKGART